MSKWLRGEDNYHHASCVVGCSEVLWVACVHVFAFLDMQVYIEQCGDGVEVTSLRCQMQRLGA